MRSPIVHDDNTVVEAMIAKDCSAFELFNSYYHNEREEVAKAKLAEWATARTIEKDFATFCHRLTENEATRGLR